MKRTLDVIQNNKVLLNSLIIIGLVLLSFLYQGYKFGYGSQVVEIPLLRNLIDQAFYGSDTLIPYIHRYYISFTFRAIAFFVRDVNAIGGVYLILTIIFRSILTGFAYLTFKTIYGSRRVGALAVLIAIISYSWGVNLFDHAILALAVIFAALYCLTKKRFLLAAFLFGTACNSHVLNSFWFCIAFLILGVFSLFTSPRDDTLPRNAVIPSFFLLALAALPISLWVLNNLLAKKTYTSLPGFNYSELLQNQQFFWFDRLSAHNMMSFWGWNWILTLILCVLLTVRWWQNSLKSKIQPAYFLILIPLLLSGPFVFFLVKLRIINFSFLARMDLWRNLQLLNWIILPFVAASEAKIMETAGYRRRLLGGLTLFAFFNNVFLVAMLLAGFLYDIFSGSKKKQFLRILMVTLPVFFYIVLAIPRMPISKAHIVKYSMLLVLFSALFISFSYVRKRAARDRGVTAYVSLVIVFITGMAFLNGTARVVKEANMLKLKPYRQNISIHPAYKEIMEYIRKNAPKDALVLLDPSETDFHLYSERAALFTEQLNFVLFDESLARKAYGIYKDLGGITEGNYSVVNQKYEFDRLTPFKLRQIAKKYNATHALLKKDIRRPASFKKIYENEEYNFYKVLD